MTNAFRAREAIEYMGHRRAPGQGGRVDDAPGDARGDVNAIAQLPD